MKSKINEHADGGKFGNLKKILLMWAKLNEQFFIQTGDGSWWYNERASISVLAAVAWMAGGVALEEFSAKKKLGKKERSGRADVYLNLKGREFACEAKFMWLSVNSRNPIDRIDAELKNACEDAESLDREEGRRFGVCFATVYVTEENVDKFSDLIEKLQKRIDSELEFDAIAWSFPAKAIKALIGDKDGRYHPGSFLILRNCD
jgi:hypothetical protein